MHNHSTQPSTSKAEGPPKPSSQTHSLTQSWGEQLFPNPGYRRSWQISQTALFQRLKHAFCPTLGGVEQIVVCQHVLKTGASLMKSHSGFPNCQGTPLSYLPTPHQVPIAC